MWVFVLACLTYCFTVGFTMRYKEQALEEREKKLQLTKDYDIEIIRLLEEISQLRNILKDNNIRVRIK